MLQSVQTFMMVLPQSSDAMGRWLEDNGAKISIRCMLGIYHVTVSWNKLHSYSDDSGEHRESWCVARHGKDLPQTLDAALKVAIEKSSK